MNYKDIGLRLKHIRGKISQKDFGNQFGVSKSYVNNVEHGSKPSIDFLINIAIAFDVSLDWIILGKQLPTSELSQCTEGTENPFRNELLQIFDTLNPDVQAVILGTVKTILQNARSSSSNLMNTTVQEDNN